MIDVYQSNDNYFFKYTPPLFIKAAKSVTKEGLCYQFLSR